jgi:hypothetical protein
MQDTYKQALVGIINKLLASDLLLPYQVENLEKQKATFANLHGASLSGLHLSLKGFDTNASLSFTNLLWEELDLVSDENGDEYAKAKLQVEVSYPSHGGCSIEVLEHRLTFFAKVLRICKEVEAEYGGELVTLVRTAEEKRAKAEKLQKVELDKQLLGFKLDHQKNLRVGGFRGGPTSIPNGVYPLGGDKTYRLTVANGWGELVRLT